jgi:hypothetical protein
MLGLRLFYASLGLRSRVWAERLATTRMDQSSHAYTGEPRRALLVFVENEKSVTRETRNAGNTKGENK